MVGVTPMTLDPFSAGYLMGALTGGLFGFMLALIIAHWKTRRPRRLELDERYRAIKRLHTAQFGEAQRLPSDHAFLDDANWLREEIQGERQRPTGDSGERAL